MVNFNTRLCMTKIVIYKSAYKVENVLILSTMQEMGGKCRKQYKENVESLEILTHSKLSRRGGDRDRRICEIFWHW